MRYGGACHRPGGGPCLDSPEDNLKVTPRGTLQTDPVTMATSRPDVFAGGDVAFGPRIIITAVAEGKRAANSIAKFLAGRVPAEPRQARVTIYDTDQYRMKPDYEKLDRKSPPTLPLDRRIGIAEVEKDLSGTRRALQADRCLKCHVGPVFNGDACILCGGCADVCNAVETILRGIRHTKGNLKEPLQSTTPRSTQQRRAIAISLLEALIGLGPALDSMTLFSAYDHCRKTLMSEFTGLTIKQIKAGKFHGVSEAHKCGDLLLAVRLTGNEEVRDARTIHQAKGTERGNVLVRLNGRDEAETQEHLNHILYPAATSDEEQRITYVGISRARDRLFLTTPILTAEQEQRALELGLQVAYVEKCS